ncbi:MAG TPA: class II aldolase/adducin family protein [Defluviitoga sp.]|nr:class II aldolase/adducin family protein [Defluviitoga sp.]HPZ74605.1 class II aldolase/adducin family protein [Candidatus Pacearchaeota archaeon]
MFEKEKLELIEYGIKVFKSGLVHGTGGNLSLRVGKEGDMYLITPSGIDYEQIVPEDIVVMSMIGEVVEGDKKPSIEHSMHREVYINRKDVNAIIHTHPLFSTALSITRQPLPPIESTIVFMGGTIQVAEYARHGSVELAMNVVKALGDKQAVLLANHGQLAVGESLPEALNNCVGVEFCAQMYILAASIGNVHPIPPEKCEELRKFINTSYGQKK